MPFAQIYLPIPDESMVFVVDVQPRVEDSVPGEHTHVCDLRLRIGPVDVMLHVFEIDGIADEDEHSPAAARRMAEACRGYVDTWLKQEYYPERQDDLVQALVEALNVIMAGQRSRTADLTVYTNEEETE